MKSSFSRFGALGLLSLVVFLMVSSSSVAEDDPILMHGVVQEALGLKRKPLPGAELEVRPTYQRHLRSKKRITVGKDGRFEIRRSWIDANLPAGFSSFVVIAWDPSRRLAPARTWLQRFSPSESETTLRLSPGVTRAVRVLDAKTKQPIAGAVVHPQDGGGPVDPVVTDSGGRARIGPLPQRDSGLSVYAKGYAYVGLDSTTTDEVALSLEPGQSVSGRVLGPDGEPLSGAVVSVNRGPDFSSLLAEARWLEELLAIKAYGTDPFASLPAARPQAHPNFERGVVSAVTDAEGRFELRGLSGKDAEVLVVHRRLMTEATKARPGQDDLEVRLSKGATLHGAARRRDGAPAIGAIEVATPLGPLFRVAAVDPDGNYRLEGLRPGTYALRCTDETALGFEESEAGKKAVGRTTALVQVEANASVRCDLTGTARVRGTLKADGKLPMSLGLILARGSGEQPAAFRRSLFSGRDYVFQGIPPGSYGLFISPGGKAENVLLGQVEVEADSEEVVLNAKVPASLVKDLAASRKAAQRKLMDKLGLDPSVLDDLDDDAAKDDDGAKAKRAEEDAADRADAELKTRLSKDLVVEPEVEKGRVTLDYPLSAPDELADFKVRGFAKARVGTVDGGAFYGSGIDLTAARRPATLLHSLELSGDVSVSLELVVFSRSPRSKLCVLLSKKVGVAWGQTICKPKSLKPYKRQRPADLSVFNGQESVKLEIRRKGDVLTVRCQGRLAGKHSFKKGELDSFRFGLFLDGVRVVVERLRLEGDVN